MRFPTIFIIAISVVLSGCSTVRLNPLANEVRRVQAISDSSKNVVVFEGMVWGDGMPPTRGLRFPPGTYILEAGDADYWYFRSPAPLEFRVFRGGQVVDARNIPGGIMIAKGFSQVPGAGYINGEGPSKVMIWKLGNEFLKNEGRSWKKTF